VAIELQPISVTLLQPFICNSCRPVLTLQMTLRESSPICRQSFRFSCV
jgi:hypothetical protein